MIIRNESRRRTAKRLGPSLDRRRILGLHVALVVLASLASLACETRHRSSVLVPVAYDAGSDGMASAGILRGENLEIDGTTSRLLAEASRTPDVSADLSTADRERLLSEPFRLAYASAWRRDLQQRIGHRRILVGELGESRISTRIEWLPIFLVWVTPPFAFAHRSDVAHPAFELRLVDLDTGRIDAEFFAMMPKKPDRKGISGPQLEAALFAMGLRGERQ